MARIKVGNTVHYNIKPEDREVGVVKSQWPNGLFEVEWKNKRGGVWMELNSEFELVVVSN